VLQHVVQRYLPMLSSHPFDNKGMHTVSRARRSIRINLEAYKTYSPLRFRPLPLPTVSRSLKCRNFLLSSPALLVAACHPNKLRALGGDTSYLPMSSVVVILCGEITVKTLAKPDDLRPRLAHADVLSASSGCNRQSPDLFCFCNTRRTV
jgi:hypothetical protein